MNHNHSSPRNTPTYAAHRTTARSHSDNELDPPHSSTDQAPESSQRLSSHTSDTGDKTPNWTGLARALHLGRTLRSFDRTGLSHLRLTRTEWLNVIQDFGTLAAAIIVCYLAYTHAGIRAVKHWQSQNHPTPELWQALLLARGFHPLPPKKSPYLPRTEWEPPAPIVWSNLVDSRWIVLQWGQRFEQTRIFFRGTAPPSTIQAPKEWTPLGNTWEQLIAFFEMPIPQPSTHPKNSFSARDPRELRFD